MTRLRLFLLVAVFTVVASGAAYAYAILVPEQGVAQGAGYPSFGADQAATIYTSSTTPFGPLTPGFYALSCGAKVWVDQGTSAVTATTSERRVPAEFVYPLKVMGVDNAGAVDTYVAIIGTNGGGNTCNLSKDDYR